MNHNSSHSPQGTPELTSNEIREELEIPGIFKLPNLHESAPKRNLADIDNLCREINEQRGTKELHFSTRTDIPGVAALRLSQITTGEGGREWMALLNTEGQVVGMRVRYEGYTDMAEDAYGNKRPCSIWTRHFELGSNGELLSYSESAHFTDTGVPENVAEPILSLTREQLEQMQQMDNEGTLDEALAIRLRQVF